MVSIIGVWGAGDACARSGGRRGLNGWPGGRCQARRCGEVEGRAEAGDWAGGRYRFEEDHNTDWLEVDEGDLPILCTSDGAEKMD